MHEPHRVSSLTRPTRTPICYVPGTRTQSEPENHHNHRSTSAHNTRGRLGGVNQTSLHNQCWRFTQLCGQRWRGLLTFPLLYQNHREAQVLKLPKRIPREEWAGKGIPGSRNSTYHGRNEKEHGKVDSAHRISLSPKASTVSKPECWNDSLAHSSGSAPAAPCAWCPVSSESDICSECHLSPCI